MITKQLKVLLDTSLSAGRTYDDIRGMLAMQGFSTEDINALFTEYRAETSGGVAAPSATPTPAPVEPTPVSVTATPPPTSPTPSPIQTPPSVAPTPPLVASTPPPQQRQPEVVDIPEVTQSEVISSDIPEGFMPESTAPASSSAADVPSSPSGQSAQPDVTVSSLPDFIPSASEAVPVMSTPPPQPPTQQPQPTHQSSNPPPIPPADPRTYMPPADASISTPPVATGTYAPPVDPSTYAPPVARDPVSYTPPANIQVGLGGVPELQHAAVDTDKVREHSAIAVYITIILLILMCMGAFFFWYFVIRDTGEVNDVFAPTTTEQDDTMQTGAPDMSREDIFAPIESPSEAFVPPTSRFSDDAGVVGQDELNNQSEGDPNSPTHDEIYGDYYQWLDAQEEQSAQRREQEAQQNQTTSSDIDPYTGQPFQSE